MYIKLTGTTSPDLTSARRWSWLVTCRRVTLLLLAIWFAAAVFIFSEPGVPGLIGGPQHFILIGSALLLGIVWSIQSLHAYFRRRQRPRPNRVWWCAPAVFVLGFALGTTHLDLAVRVWLCETELQDFAAARTEARSAQAGMPQWVGLFRVEGVFIIDSDTHFRTGFGFFSDYGIAYRPHGGPGEVFSLNRVVRYVHLFGSWYRYEGEASGPF